MGDRRNQDTRGGRADVNAPHSAQSQHRACDENDKGSPEDVAALRFLKKHDLVRIEHRGCSDVRDAGVVVPDADAGPWMGGDDLARIPSKVLADVDRVSPGSALTSVVRRHARLHIRRRERECNERDERDGEDSRQNRPGPPPP